MKVFPFPNRLNLKWWHRLTKVFILAVFIFSCFISIAITFAAIDETKVMHKIYEFERGYSFQKGTIQKVTPSNARGDLLNRMVAASKEAHSDNDGRELELKKAIDLDEMKSIFGSKSDLDLQRNYLNALEEINQPMHLKIWFEYSFFPELLLLFIGPIIYSILIGCYGVTLYVVFGSNPFSFSH